MSPLGTADPQAPLTVLVNAGPWLPLPCASGGLEDVVAELVAGLRSRGVRVVLATVGESTIEADEKVSAFEHGQHHRMGESYVWTNAVPGAHMQVVVDRIRAGGIDVVHDHLEVVGPSVLAALGEAGPPVLHTVHWRIDKHEDFRRFYELFDGRGRVGIVARSHEQRDSFPASLRAQSVAVVPNGVAVPDFPLPPPGGGPLLMLNDVAPLYGQDFFARACRDLDIELTLAGPLAGITSPAELEAARWDADRAKELAGRTTYAWFADQVEPALDTGVGTVCWIGTVSGTGKWQLLRSARALLTTCTSGQSVIQALSLGVPVVSTAEWGDQRLIADGVNGFVIDRDPAALKQALDRLPLIGSDACRASVAAYTADAMVEAYLDLYRRVVAAVTAR